MAKILQVQNQVYPSKSYVLSCKYVEKSYEIEGDFALIAKTRHSTVYRAFSGKFNREVAIKIIDKTQIPKELVTKFLPRELQITKLVQHPHIVRCLAVAENVNPTKVVITYEFYNGGTLLQYVLKRKRLDEKNGARIFRQLIEAIHYLHNYLFVCHRDIKMENILMDKFTDIKLADFGFARFLNKAESSTSFCGTQPYSAPQLVEQKPYNGFAADWYASGVVLFTMLSGKWPHEPGHKCPFPLHFPVGISELARSLIVELMNPDETQRPSYQQIVRSEWLKVRTNDKWLMADDYFVYDLF